MIKRTIDVDKKDIRKNGRNRKEAIKYKLGKKPSGTILGSSLLFHSPMNDQVVV
jgi:hypothetical protein